jgi:HEAT repeat protein
MKKIVEIISTSLILSILAILVLVVLLSTPGSFAFASTALVTVDYPVLCPKGEHQKGISLNGRTISIPKILEEKELLKRLRSGDEKESRTAAVSLALGGNLKAFSFLLEKRDLNLLSIYGSYYQNRNGSRCVDPIIENKIIESFDDRELREYLLTFFGKNLYQSRKLFEKLLAVDITLNKTRFFTAMIRSLVATNQPDIEKKVHEHAMRYIVNVKLKYWHNFLPIDKYYLDFFVQRNYKPAVSYVQDILDETHYSIVPRTHRTHVYNRHRGLYYQLDKYPSSAVERVFAKQLSKLENITRDKVFFNIELESAGRFALKHALSYEGRNNIVQYLAGILATEQAYDPAASDKDLAYIDYKMRSQAIEFLAQAGTRDSGRILIREMNRHAGTTGVRSSASLVSQILTNLSALPASVEIDVPEFMKAVKKLDERSQLLTVPHILGKHPHPEGHAFLLSQLQDIASSGEGFRMNHGIKSKAAYKMIFDILITFDAADYLFLTRQQVDSLFDEGNLDEKLYISSSKQLNALIGNESALYTALREKREAEEIERKRNRVRDEKAKYQKQFEDHIRENMSSEGIKKNIQALSRNGSRSKNAAMWLVITGPDILPYVHKVIRLSDTDIKVKHKLISILGAIGDARSIPPILDAVRSEPKSNYKDVFLALSEMPMTKESFDFASAQLSEKSNVVARRSALVYFAAHRDRRARKWAKKYSSTDAGSELRLAALFLLARLGEPDAKGLILESLKREQKQSNLGTLLRALAEVTTLEEFTSHTGDMNLDEKTKWYKTAQWITEFRNAEGKRKAVFAERLLTSDNLWDIREAARYLISEVETEILQRHLLPDPRVEHPLVMEAMQHRAGRTIYLEARKMGYHIEETPEGIRLIKNVVGSGLPQSDATGQDRKTSYRDKA